MGVLLQRDCSVLDSLIDVIAQAGRHYQPWVADATVSGAATVEFGDGITAEIASTPFLNDATGRDVGAGRCLKIAAA